MMSNIVFKRLFEVKILHDYFLTNTDGISFFKRTIDDKKDIISKKLARSIYDVSDLFTIEPTAATKLKMKEYKLIMRKTALGFTLGTQVKVKNLAGETVYQPRFGIDNSIHLTFSIKPQASVFNSITNISLRPPLPSIYYFNTKDKVEFTEELPLTYTSLPLSNKARGHQNGMLHEMGALIEFGAGIREATQYTDNNGGDLNLWDVVADRRFVSDADRLLLPHNFSYNLNKADAVTALDLVLEDESNTEIKIINKTGAEALENVFLNFSVVDEAVENPVSIPDGFYTLKVKQNGGPEIIYPVYINNSLYTADILGVIDISSEEPGSPYSLLDAEGFLKTRINAANQIVPHPVFEIRFKNRRTYWRYNKEIDFSNDEKNNTQDFLNEISDVELVSDVPKAFTEALVPFRKLNPVLELTLPHPKKPSIKVEGEKIYSDIYINLSNRLLDN